MSNGLSLGSAVKMAIEVSLDRSFFSPVERRVLRQGGLTASIFRYDTGVEALRLINARGYVEVLPFMGQMIWRANFDGVELAMQSMFDQPRPASTIVETYGCLCYHAGLLRNGVPTAQDSHALHGEFPCLPMDAAGLECGEDAQGPWVAVVSRRDYAMGFGAHYLATPRVMLRENATTFDVTMEVQNLSAAPMDLMYICHANFAFVENARIVQPAPFTPEHVVTRTAIPGHVRPNDDYRALLADLANNPARMEFLREPNRYDPEQVFYIKNLRRAEDGRAHFLYQRPEGDGFLVAFDPAQTPHTIRWILANSDQRTCAFAMPGTCEPEGYAAESAKGHVRSLAGGARVAFVTQLGYADRNAAAKVAREIQGEG